MSNAALWGNKKYIGADDAERGTEREVSRGRDRRRLAMKILIARFMMVTYSSAGSGGYCPIGCKENVQQKLLLAEVNPYDVPNRCFCRRTGRHVV